jgi:hypothetical protein
VQLLLLFLAVVVAVVLRVLAVVELQHWGQAVHRMLRQLLLLLPVQVQVAVAQVDQ